MVGVADHHAGRRINAGAAQIVGAKLYLAYAVNVRKAEQLGKKALQTPGGYLLDQVITAGGRKHSLLPAHAGQRLQGVNGVCRYSAAGHTGVVVLHKAGGKLRVGMPRKVEPGAAVVVLDGKAEQLPVGSQIVPLGVAVGLQHPVQAVVGKIHIVHQGTVPVPEDHTVRLHENLLVLFRRKHLAQCGVALDQLYQHDAQHGTADQLTNAHRDAVGDAGQPDGGAGRGVREHHGDLDADDHRVEQHRGQAGGNGQTLEAHIAQLVGDQTGQQGGQRAKDHIHDGGAQQVCKEAAQHNTYDVLGTEHGQQAQSLGHAHLHSTIGKGLQCQTQHHIDGCHYTAVHQLTDGRILIHDNTPAV